jgi:serine phosphatase RsbU (regulator of sigma subunit)
MARDRGEGAEAGRGRGTKVPSGPSFALTIGMAAGVAAALLAFLAAFLVGAANVADPAAAMDAAGVQAARMLAAPGAERWRRSTGTTESVRMRARAWYEDQLAKGRVNKALHDKAWSEFMSGKPGTGADWRPGVDMVFPPSDPQDEPLGRQWKEALTRVSGASPGALVGAAVRFPSDMTYTGNPLDPQGPPSATAGDTRIWAFADGRRLYVHPVLNKEGGAEATAIVTLSAAGLSAPSPMATAGAAAGAAFLGAFLLGFVLALGPVKAIRKLALDADALGSGHLDTRVSVSGPDVVQAAARGVQKLAQYASSAASSVPSEPQYIQQQVMVQPVAEVQEGLAPLKGFKRPEELEIEATAKPCPDLGNDYYDVVNVDDDRVGIFIADIPGQRGVRGAMYMAQIRAIFRAVSPREQSPAEVLKLLNRAFAMDLPRGIYVTAMYAIVDRTSGVCRVANAQHLPLVFWKLAKKASARLAPEGIALGLDAGPVFDKTIVEKAVQLERGDRVVLFTDGAMNARNAAGAQYGEERFYYVVNREAPKNSAACVNFVANDVDLFHEGAPQVDDFTIVTARMMR